MKEYEESEYKNDYQAETIIILSALLASYLTEPDEEKKKDVLDYLDLINVNAGGGGQSEEEKERVSTLLDSYLEEGVSEVDYSLFVTNELYTAQENGKLESEKKKGVNLYAESKAEDGACGICKELHGKTVEIGEPMLKLGEIVTYNDVDEWQNDYKTMYSPPYHPNCRCKLEFKEKKGSN